MSRFLFNGFSEKFLICSLCVLILFSSHIFIPEFNDGRDIFVFSTWSLFSNGPNESVVDISWDQGETFLFRDHRLKAKNMGINLSVLSNLMNSEFHSRLESDFCEELRRLSSGGAIEIFTIKNTLAKHIIYKKNGTKLDVLGVCGG